MTRIPEIEKNIALGVELLSENLLCAEAGETCANIVLFERDDDGVFAHVVAHIPQIMDVANYEATLTAWCEKFDTEDINGVSVQVDVIPGPPSGEAVKFHWNRVLGLCAALDDESDADRSSGRLLDRLKIPPKMRRHPGPIGEGLLEFSGALTVAAIENSSINHMGALSAFDASAWPWIRSGWERKEHTDRQEEIKKRQHAIAQLQKLWASDHDRQRVEVEKLLNEWAREPESRARRWHGGA